MPHAKPKPSVKRTENVAPTACSGRIGSEPQSISIRISDQHFPGSPGGVLRRLSNGDAVCNKLAVAGVHVGNLKIHSTTDLAISRVFRQENGLAVPSDLVKKRKSGLELMRPVDRKPKTVTIEPQACFCAKNPELGNDGLFHISLGDAANYWLEPMCGVRKALVADQISQFAVKATRTPAFPNAILKKLRA